MATRLTNESVRGFFNPEAEGAMECEQLAEQQKARKKNKRQRKKQKGFYNSSKWLKVRYQALKLHGAVCCCCGSTRKPMHVDHIKPRARYPALELEPDNLQVLCEACNLGKGADDMTDWR